jgi:DNA-binding transcriptional regulator/RsmH inhibitor MraZ
LFVGRHARNLDRKGRLAIPAEFLNRLGPDERDEIYVTPGERGCVWLLPKSYYEAFAAKVQESQDDDVADVFFHYSQLRSIDKAGRLLLDEGAREFAGIPDPQGDDACAVMVCGSGHYMQVWEQGDYLGRVPDGRTFAQSLRRIRRQTEETLK